jgi:hypothetical protein
MKRPIVRLILLSILVGVIAGSFASICHAESIKTRADLLATLIRLRAQYPEWTKSYKVGVWDCSDQSAKLHRILVSEGFTAFIAVGHQLSVIHIDDDGRMRYDLPRNYHAKLLCYVWADKRIEATWVEATLLCVTTSRFLPRHVFSDTSEANRVYQGEF